MAATDWRENTLLRRCIGGGGGGGIEAGTWLGRLAWEEWNILFGATDRLTEDKPPSAPIPMLPLTDMRPNAGGGLFTLTPNDCRTGPWERACWEENGGFAKLAAVLVRLRTEDGCGMDVELDWMLLSVCDDDDDDEH